MSTSENPDLYTLPPRPRDPALPRIRVEPDDFAVEELSNLELEGEGHHTYLWVEKRGANTADVAFGLAQIAGIDPKEVGYAGLKDKNAVTRQWFSVLHLDPEAARGLEIPGVTVLQVEQGRRRLRAGMLEGNRFRLLVRNVAPEAAAAAIERLKEIERRGMPNRFGHQRFGGGGRNIRLGLEILQGKGKKRHRRTRNFLVSALQSAVFNEVLRRRPVAHDEVLVGDLALVHAANRLEIITEPEAEVERLEKFEISATGPLFGFKAKRPGPRVDRLEHEVLEDFGLGDLYGLRLPRGLRLFGGRRAVRARVGEPGAEIEGDTLKLGFDLPAGSYATVLLEELFPGGFTEGDRAVPGEDGRGEESPPPDPVTG